MPIAAFLRGSLAAGALFVSGCGGSSAAQPPAESASAAASPSSSLAAAPAPVSDAPPAAALPSSCADPAATWCTPPRAFADRICDKPHQDVALALFAKGTPFSRIYLKGNVDELLFDEEVLLLRVHEPSRGGMIVGSGKGTYDVLRWDGSCAMGVEAEVFTRSRPPHPRAAHVQWHRVGAATQDALIGGSEAVKHAHGRRGKECKGAMTGDVSAACEKADRALVDAVVDYVRSGGSLPAPAAP